MKKGLLFSSLAGIMMLSACTHNNNTSTSTYNFPTYNFVTSLSDGTAEIVPSFYKFDMDLIAQTMTMSSTFSVANSSVNVLEEQIPFEGFYANQNGAIYEILSFKKKNADVAASGNAVSNLKGEFTLLANLPPEIQGLPEVYLPVGRYVCMSYDLGSKYNVRTLWTDMTFTGTTTTSMPSMAPYTNNDVKYRVILNIKEKKATVIIYDAKFADKMPSITNIVLKDLPLTLSIHGYTITGKDIVPEVYEGGVGVPNSRYKFDEFEFSSEDNLTEGICTYTVAGSMNGYFKGAYLKTLESLQEKPNE